MKQQMHRTDARLAEAGLLILFGVVEAPAAHGQLLFSDQTRSAGLIAVHAPGLGFSLSPVHDISPMLSAGVVGDFNNDGWQDLFVIIGGGAPDKLFINNGNGTFTDQAVAWGIAQPHLGIGAAVGDYDRDGWLDIFITSFGTPSNAPQIGKHRLYHNNHNNTFTNVAVSAGVNNSGAIDGMGPAFGDYDLDGDLDLFIPGWLGGGNRLFRNNGNGTFTQVTVAAGVVGSTVFGFSPRFIDMDGDRYPELLLAADFGTSRYYRNNKNGTFTNYTAASGTGLDGNGMGQAVADFNNDGLFDWYVTSVYSLDSGIIGVPGTGNMLYKGIGQNHYDEIAHAAGVYDGGWGWGTVAVDLDNDGWVDLVETNGWYEPDGANQLEWYGEQSYLFHNNGDGTFNEMALDCGMIDMGEGRGMINFDYDNDGDQDIVIFEYNGSLKLFRNDTVIPNTHWLRVFLNTQMNPKLAPNGYGTHLRVIAGDKTLHRSICGGSNYLSQSELSAEFGLGNQALIDELRIMWNDGTQTVMHNVAADQTLTISSGYLCDISGDGKVGVDDLLAVINQWGFAQPSTTADLNSDGIVNVNDLMILLSNWNP